MVVQECSIGVTLLLILGCVPTMKAQLEVLHSWRTVDFEFPSQASRNAMIRTGRFVPNNIAIIDVDVSPLHNQKVFVTMPRFKAGTPATLATVGLGGLLRPYPDWSYHREGDCDGITSVFRTQVDTCGRLWVLDSGVVDIFTGSPRRICQPQLLVFDLNTDKLIGKYQFPDSVLDSDSLLTTIKVDTRDRKCYDTFVYVADVVSYKLIVFDATRHRSWRISSNYFYPYPLNGHFDINGAQFDLMDGILGLALSPQAKNGDRYLFFHSLASVRESWVLTSVIRNESLFLNGNGSPDSFHVSQYTRPSQSAAEDMSSSGILFFGLLSNNSIACWNPRTTYSPENIYTVAQNSETMQFASGMKIYGDGLWVLSSRLQNYIVNKVPENEINYRVLHGRVSNLIRGTRCNANFIDFYPKFPCRFNEWQRRRNF